MGNDRRLRDSRGYEAQVDDTLKALQVKTYPASTADLDTLETSLDALETLLTGTAKVKIWDGTNALSNPIEGETFGATKGGIIALTIKQQGAQYLALRSAAYNDTLANKGLYVLPVTPMTSERLEGTKITDGVDTQAQVAHADAGATSAKGPMVHGTRWANQKCYALPVAQYSDPTGNKGDYVIPVTPMTGLRTEGTITHTADINSSIAFGVAAIDAKTGYVLVDLSDATNYPHTLTGEIHVDWLSICIHGNATAEGQIHIGFISAIDADHATIHTIACLQIAKLEAITVIHKNYNPSAVICKTENHLSGGTLLFTDDVTFQDDTEVAGTFDNATPAVGDLVMIVNATAGTFENVAIAVGYHTEA